MPITANSNRIAYGVQRYVFDTKQELDELFIGATEKGSTAFIIEEGKTYILNGQRVWVEKLGGGGSPFPYDTIVYDGGLEEDHDTEKTVVYDGGLEV